MMKLFNLKGRVALVTGSSRGIGRSIALALAEAGATVAVHGIRQSENLLSIQNEIRANGGQAVAVTGDIGDSSDVAGIVQACRETCGAPDILVLNASAQAYMPLDEFSAAEFDKEFAANVRSAMELVRAVLPNMKAKGWGRILSIGSVNQWKPSPRLPVYAATKSALANFIIYCARHYSSFGITANNLAPGVITTDRNAEALSDQEFSDKLLAGIPAGRFGTPEDCAGLALLLCSDAGAYITGEDIAVDGGMRL
jgi:glucose 1-dehydrogenase